MNPLRIGLAVLLVFGVSAARADDNKDLDMDKLVGTWELTKGETLPPGSTWFGCGSTSVALNPSSSSPIGSATTARSGACGLLVRPRELPHLW